MRFTESFSRILLCTSLCDLCALCGLHRYGCQSPEEPAFPLALVLPAVSHLSALFTLLAHQRITLDAMPDFRRLPLSQLIFYCPPLLQATSPDARGAWVELYRRALVEANQAAWDALLMRLWPAILHWIYSYAPEVSPATAERIAQRAINEFKHHQVPPPRADSPLPGYEQLVRDLHQVVARLLDFA